MAGLKKSQHLKLELKDILVATKNFETKIGQGGFGMVYKGELRVNGKHTTVAVKRLNERYGQGLKEFLTEIQLLTGQVHPNVISLLGYCDEHKEKILVYEYAAQGSLDQYIRGDESRNTLTWVKRLKICADAARGLDHLHRRAGKHQAIIHRDIKSANILLDGKWVAKISDLGLSKLTFAGLDRSAVVSLPCGTQGYCDPESVITGIVKKESDVYSFGVVLFEVICGRLCVVKDNDGFSLTANSAKQYYEKKKLEEIIDPRIRDQMSPSSLSKISDIAYRCLDVVREKRPSMDVVATELEQTLKIQMEYESRKEEENFRRRDKIRKATQKRTFYDKYGEEGQFMSSDDELSMDELLHEILRLSIPNAERRDMGGSRSRLGGQFPRRGEGSTSMQPRKGEAIQRLLPCSLEDLYKGTTQRIKIRRDVIGATGRPTPVDEILTIEIKPGWKKGTKITFEKRGNEQRGVIPSDLVFIIDEKPHAVFKRDGNDLVITQKVLPTQAFTGFNTQITTLDGRRLRIRVKSVISPTYEEVVIGEGMPISKEPGKKGNLRVKFDINFPTRHTS